MSEHETPPPTAPTPSGGEMPQQPSAALQQQEQERRRLAIPRVLRAYAADFDRGYVPDSDAGPFARRAADEIESLRAALLAARRGERALRDALEEILYAKGEATSWLDLVERMRSAAAAALAATPEEKNATP